MHDGSIVFNTKIDNADVEKDLRALKKKIQSANESISKNENAKLPLVKQAEQLGAKLDAAKKNLEYIREEMSSVQAAMAPGSSAEDYIAASANYERVKASLDAQEKEVADLQKQWDKVNDKIDGYNVKIKLSTEEIARSTAEAGRLQAKLEKGTNPLPSVFENAGKSAERFGKRLWSISKSVLVFSLLRSALRGAVGYMGKVLKTNSEYTAQLAKLKAALLTAFQPIYEFVLPGLIMVLKVLTSIVQLFAQFLSWLTGKSLKQSAQNAQNLYNQANAIEAVGEAAKEASKDLASFDEINRIGSKDIGIPSVSGGDAVVPDFIGMDGSLEMENSLKRILALVGSIAAGFLAWKIASHFTEDLAKIAGIALSVGGAALYAYNWFDALSNGIDWGNLTGMLAGMTALVAGLTLAFGKTGGAVGLLITSVGLLGVALMDWIETGELTNEALVTLEVGILGVGLAISLLTGSWIPLLIAAIVGVAVAVGTRADQIQAKLTQLDAWLQGVFTNDWRNTFGPVLGSIMNLFMQNAKRIWDNVRTIFNGFLDFLGGVFTANWSRAWNGIKQIFQGVFNSLPSIAQSAINTIISIVQSAISWINQLISKIFSARSAASRSHSGFGGFFANGGVLSSGWGIVGEAGPEIIRMVNGRAIITPLDIPYLAQGAVLPANKPFMAMVGDQKHGTNIEAPLETIQDAVALVMEDNIAAMLAGFEAVVQAIQEKNLSVSIGDRDIGEANDRYSRRIALRRGT